MTQAALHGNTLGAQASFKEKIKNSLWRQGLYKFGISFTLIYCMARFAQASQSGAFSFLESGFGARALGLGNALTSVADDPYAAYWNPAGLTRMDHKGNQIAFNSAILGQDRLANFGSYAHRFDGAGALGISLAHYGVLGIDLYDGQGKSIGSSSDQEFAALISLARDANFALRYGVNIKALHQNLIGQQAYGYGLDLGISLAPYEGSYMLMGAVLQNIASGVYWQDGLQEQADTQLRLGISDRFVDWRLLLSLDAIVPLGSQNPVFARLGAEYWFDENFALRVGLDHSSPTGGLSIKVDSYELAYGISAGVDGLGVGQQVGLVLKF